MLCACVTSRPHEPSSLSCRLGRRALAASATLLQGRPPTLPPLQRQPTQLSLSTKLCAATRWRCSARQVGAHTQAGCASARMEGSNFAPRRGGRGGGKGSKHTEWCPAPKVSPPSLACPLCAPPPLVQTVCPHCRKAKEASGCSVHAHGSCTCCLRPHHRCVPRSAASIL